MQQIRSRKEEDISEFIRLHRDVIEKHSGKISNVTIMSGGLVNYVYRIQGECSTVIAKLRKSEFSALPNIRINPFDIVNESQAILQLQSEFPNVFPKHLGFYPDRSMLIISDIMENQHNMQNRFADKSVDTKIVEELGKQIAEIHYRFRNISVPIRKDGDIEYYSQNLTYRLGYHDNSALENLIDKLMTMPRQLIHADLSPKNIGIDDVGRVHICDLEMVHMGNPIFDLGFVIAHVLVHTIKEEQSTSLVESLLKGYYSIIHPMNVDSEILKQITLGIILYRLDNHIIPYEININDFEKNKIVRGAKTMLSCVGDNWREIIGFLSERD